MSPGGSDREQLRGPSTAERAHVVGDAAGDVHLPFELTLVPARLVGA